MAHLIDRVKRKYLHWRWQCRWDRAWKRANRRANSFYYEDIAYGNPWCYLQEELNDLRHK